ncbi:MAG: hypothetical protein ACKVT0_04130 [Planctomycetaceae bacterium]
MKFVVVLLIALPMGQFAIPKNARAQTTGIVTATVTQPETIKSAFAIDRQIDRKYPATVDLTTGRLTIDSLPLGRTYDVIINTAQGSWEGISLKVPPSDYVEEQPLAAEERQIVEEKVRELNKFEDQVEVLAIEGNIQHAAILVNKLRTKPFFGSKPGEIVWRAELWHFEKPEETWVKVQDELFLVLHRERLLQSSYDKKSLIFDPQLGGIAPTAENPAYDAGTIDLAELKPGVRLRANDSNPSQELNDSVTE